MEERKEVSAISEEMTHIERVIGNVLRLGVALSVVVMLLGFLLLFVRGQSGYAADKYPTTLRMIWLGLWEFKAYAWLMAGLFLLILTPVLRVLVSIVAFAKEHDRLYVWITVVVLVILLTAMLIGEF